MMRPVRPIAAVVPVLLACAVAVGSVGTASATDGHLPGFSLMSRRVAVSKLPPPIRYSFGEFPGEPFHGPGPHIRGPVWFGKVERPNATIYAAGVARRICEAEQPDGARGVSSSSCTSLAGARDLGLLQVGSCGRGRPRHFRIGALVPNGVTGLEIEGADGSVGRTVPVIDNTVAFSVGRKNIVLRGVGDAAAEEIERALPLVTAANHSPAGAAGCSIYSFFEAGSKEEGR